MTADEQRALEALAGPGVREVVLDPTRRLIVLPRVKLPAGSKPAEAFAIYHVGEHCGYSTRLFFEEPICGANGVMPQTVSLSLLDRMMYSPSYNGIPADLPLHQGVLAHLRMYEAVP